ncbi:type II secretion system protein N [Burkholderiaceae bacterium DAT-1]|nr:type II secretion system protein N [Burkholderiaceae bacterium DAT-1]
MTRLNWKWWTYLVIACLTWMIATLPARIMASIVEKQSGGLISLHSAEGTIWQGGAQLALQQQGLIDRVNWQWQPKSLLSGVLAYTLEGTNGLHAEILAGFSKTELRNVSISLPAAPLFQLDKRLHPLNLGGTFHLNATTLLIHGQSLTGSMSLDWQNASSSLVTGANPLGDYRLNLMPNGKSWQGQLSTQSGSLQLQGNGNWQINGKLIFDLTLRAAEGSEAALAPLLNQIGSGPANAERHLNFTF